MTDRRKKGTGSITKVNDSLHVKKPWRASYLLPNGKVKTKYFAKDSEARAWLRELNALDRNIQASFDYGVTFGAYSGIFLEYKKSTEKLKPRSMSMLAGNVERVNEYLGNLKLSEIDNNAVQLMIKDLSSRGYSKSVMEKSVYAVTALLRYAASQKVLATMPVFNIDYPARSHEKVRDARNNWLKTDEMKRYSEECVKTYVPKKYTKHAGETLLVHESGYKLLLLLHTGMRVGEAMALTWDKFDDYSKTLIIDQNLSIVDGEKIFQTPKTSSGERLIVLNKQALKDLYELKKNFDAQTEILKERKEKELKNAKRKYQGAELRAARREIEEKYKGYFYNHKYICGASTFPFGSGDPHSLGQTHKKICQEIFLNHNVTVHGLRHTYVTQYYLKHKNDDDFDLPTFSKSIGHKDVRTTMTIYAHLEMAENRHIERSMDDLKDF